MSVNTSGAFGYSIADYVSSVHDKGEAQASPQQGLFICTTPRTGGHYLCNTLARAGIGLPTEYFGPQIALPLMARWLGRHHASLEAARDDMPAYGEFLLRKRTRGGVFCAKLFFHDLRMVRRAMPEVLQRATFLFVLRRDVVAQTISFLTLLKTGRAFDSNEGLEDIPRVNVVTEAIALRSLRWIERQNAMWAQFLSDQRHVFWTDTESVIENADGFATVVAKHFNCLPAPKTGIEGSSQRYAKDAEIKAELTKRFSPLLRKAMATDGASFMPPKDAVRVC